MYTYKLFHFHDLTHIYLIFQEIICNFKSRYLFLCKIAVRLLVPLWLTSDNYLKLSENLPTFTSPHFLYSFTYIFCMTNNKCFQVFMINSNYIIPNSFIPSLWVTTQIFNSIKTNLTLHGSDCMSNSRSFSKIENSCSKQKTTSQTRYVRPSEKMLLPESGLFSISTY